MIATVDSEKVIFPFEGEGLSGRTRGIAEISRHGHTFEFEERVVAGGVAYLVIVGTGTVPVPIIDFRNDKKICGYIQRPTAEIYRVHPVTHYALRMNLEKARIAA